MAGNSDPGCNFPVTAGDDMVCLLDREQICSSANDAFLEAFGKQRDDVVGQRATDPGGRESFAGVIEDSIHDVLAGKNVSTS
jgi:PAS domain-containing protein